MNRIFFIHIPRTMGTTLKNIFLAPYFFQAHLDWTWLNAHDSTIEAMRTYQFVAGHIGHGAYHKLPQDFKRITILREPIQRAYSMWRFVRKTPRHYLHQLANQMTLKQFASDHRTRQVISDYQARFLANPITPAEIVQRAGRDMARITNHFETYYPGSEDLLYRQAVAVLDGLDFVCFSDHFYGSVHAMWRRLGFEPLIMTKGLKSHAPPITAKDRDVLKAVNKVDLMLYAHALEAWNDIK